MLLGGHNLPPLIATVLVYISTKGKWGQIPSALVSSVVPADTLYRSYIHSTVTHSTKNPFLFQKWYGSVMIFIIICSKGFLRKYPIMFGFSFGSLVNFSLIRTKLSGFQLALKLWKIYYRKTHFLTNPKFLCNVYSATCHQRRT